LRLQRLLLVARLLQVVASEKVAVLNGRAGGSPSVKTKCRQPSRILATAELKAMVGYCTELTANSFSRGFQQSSNAKDHWHFCARFLSARLLATPKVLIRPAPPASLFPTGTFIPTSRSITLRTSRRWRPFLTVYRVTSLAESDTVQFVMCLGPVGALKGRIHQLAHFPEVSKVREVNLMSECPVTGPFDPCRLLY